MRMLALGLVLVSLTGPARAFDPAIEFQHLRACQYLSATDPADGAINDLWGGPTWVVPGEMAVAGWVLARGGFGAEAAAAASYLARIQNADGSWCNQYSGTVAVDSGRYARHTAQAVFFLAAAGGHAAAIAAGTAWLAALQDPAVKQGSDDGLVCGGYDGTGAVLTDRWTSDNAFAVLAFDVAGDGARRDRIVAALNALLRTGDHWVRSIDKNGVTSDGTFGWINFAPAFLDLRYRGVAYPSGLASGIRARIQESAGVNAGAVREFADGPKYMPGIGFQASLAWASAGDPAAAQAHTAWAETTSGLWQSAADANGDAGGWIDWSYTAGGGTANWWERFVDTSAYAIMVAKGWRFADPVPVPPSPAPPSFPDTVVLYPQPAAGDSVTVAVRLAPGEDALEAQAYNAAMERVYRGRWNAVDAAGVTINGLRRWAPGVYLLRLRTFSGGRVARLLRPARLVVRR
ncbi:MAG: hypothetical protein AAB152_14420 [Candidatus Coatesbacteria bacterium]